MNLFKVTQSYIIPYCSFVPLIYIKTRLVTVLCRNDGVRQQNALTISNEEGYRLTSSYIGAERRIHMAWYILNTNDTLLGVDVRN